MMSAVKILFAWLSAGAFISWLAESLVLTQKIGTIASQQNSSDHCAEHANSLSFEDFIKIHGHQYKPGTEEYELRRSLFEKRAVAVRAQNCQDGAWFSTVNHLADRTPAELDRLRGWKHGPGGDSPPQFLQLSSEQSSHSSVAAHALPRSVDWRHLQAMRDVRNQGDCGSCWALSAATVMSAHAEIHATRHSFSPQHLLQCVENPQKCGGTGGCDGATVELAFAHAFEHGLVSYDRLPYEGEDPPPPCTAPDAPETSLLEAAATDISLLEAAEEAKSLSADGRAAFESSTNFGMEGWQKLPENEVEPLLRALQDGPVSVALMATENWNGYGGGVLDDCPAEATVNHAVALVGYGETGDGDKYWLVQNSWGAHWGEGGFLRLRRRSDGEEQARCGWDYSPQEGAGCAGGPDKVWVCGTCGILYDAVRPIFRRSGSPLNSSSSMRPF